MSAAEDSIDPSKRQMLTSVLDAIRQPDPGDAARATMDDAAIDAALEQLPDDSKRELVGQIVTVLAGAGLLLTLNPKDAHADLSMNEVRDAVTDALRNVLGPLIRVLMRVFEAQAGFGIPLSVQHMITMLIHWLHSTPETVITDDPTEVLERSWPLHPPHADSAKRHDTLFMAEATRARTIQSAGMFHAASSNQATATADEAAIVGHAAADFSILTKINATNALLASLCARVGTLTMTVAAHGQLSAHDTIRSSHEVESQQHLIERFLHALDQLAAAPSRDERYLG